VPQCHPNQEDGLVSRLDQSPFHKSRGGGHDSGPRCESGRSHLGNQFDQRRVFGRPETLE
jgi:hypothetical protein